jgi:uncharacterized protein YgbK (DUF1537 family)
MLPYPGILQTLPPVWPEDLRTSNRNQFIKSGRSLIVLDDDPTGTQTVHNVPVLCHWHTSAIASELQNGTPLFYLLTNSRSMTGVQAAELAFEIGMNIRDAERMSGRKTLVISRSDSTLRGHYPIEVDSLGAGLGMDRPAHLIVPAFFEGGRLTLNDVHYVHEGDRLQPVGSTMFARDASFGYRSSNLREWVAEKTGGRISSGEVATITLNDIRLSGPGKAKQSLLSLGKGQVCVVNAVQREDLDVLAAGFLQADGCFDRILIRSAASLIPALAGMKPGSLLGRNELRTNGRPGLIAVGSYVPKTTAQLEFLLHSSGLDGIELHAGSLLVPEMFEQEVCKAAQRIDNTIQSGKTAVIFTSRAICTGTDSQESLKIVNRVSRGMTEVIRRIASRPSFILAKGGITSSDIATKGLGLQKAVVVGQALPGVPVWRLQVADRFEGMTYLPFPGNVGGVEALFEVYTKLS